MKKVNEQPRSNYGFWDEKAFDRGRANKDREKMVFDWINAARQIKDKKPKVARAGLQDDFKFENGVIYKDGKIHTEDRTYLSSTWAKPILVLDDEVYECFIMEEQTEYNDSTKWPQEAIDILKGET